MTKRAAIILAAGHGTRMKSPIPKVLHAIGGRTMLDRAIDLAESLHCDRIVVIVGAHSEDVQAHVVSRLGADCIAVQNPPQGTGDAVKCAADRLSGFSGQVVVLFSDTPLVPKSVVEPLFAALDRGGDLSVLGF